MEALNHRRSVKSNRIIHSVTADGLTTVRFSTEKMPAGERAAILREVIGWKLLGVDIEPPSNRAFRMIGTLRKLPGTRNSSYRATSKP